MEKSKPKLLTKEEYDRLVKANSPEGGKKMTVRQWNAYYGRKRIKEFVGKATKTLEKKMKKGKGKGGFNMGNVIEGLEAVNPKFGA